MDGLHLQRVSEDEGDALLLAGVGEPVPGEGALAGDDQAVAEGLDGGEEVLGVGGNVLMEQGVSLLVEDADGARRASSEAERQPAPTIATPLLDEAEQRTRARGDRSRRRRKRR